MAVQASKLIADFQLMVNEKWQYVANSAERGKVDCSGAFTYWYAQEGSKMYHGSNTMYRKWSTEKGRIGEIQLVPGMAVYKNKHDGNEPEEYRNDGQGNFYHVGLYIGNDTVIEAKGTNYGVVTSKLSQWSYASRQKNTVYDVGVVEPEVEPVIYEKECSGVVTTKSGSLNLRAAPTTSAKCLRTIPRGSTIDILQANCGTPGWYYIAYGGTTGYVMSQFVTLETGNTTKRWLLQQSVNDKSQASALEAMGITVTFVEVE